MPNSWRSSPWITAFSIIVLIQAQKLTIPWHSMETLALESLIWSLHTLRDKFTVKWRYPLNWGDTLEEYKQRLWNNDRCKNSSKPLKFLGESVEKQSKDEISNFFWRCFHPQCASQSSRALVNPSQLAYHGTHERLPWTPEGTSNSWFLQDKLKSIRSKLRCGQQSLIICQSFEN